jgi:fatty acid desaturase
MIYSLRALLDKQPVTISAAVKAAVLCLVTFGVISWSGEQVAALLVALELVLALFVQSKTANKATLDEVADTTAEAAQAAAKETVKALRPRPLRSGG